MLNTSQAAIAVRLSKAARCLAALYCHLGGSRLPVSSRMPMPRPMGANACK